MGKLTQDEFIARSIAKHGDLYDYSQVTYVGVHEKVTIICKSCNLVFTQEAGSHMRGNGCPTCGQKKSVKTQTRTKDQFVSQSIAKHGDLYDYSQVLYVNRLTKVSILCKACNSPFYQRPSDHLDGNGCPHCKGKRISKANVFTHAEFINRSRAKHGDKYDYSQAVYTGRRNKVTIICKSCDLVFTQEAGSHMRGYGCPRCGQEKSKKSQTDTKDQFVADCITKHGDLYNYKSSIYVNNYTKIDILCNTCGIVFSQVATEHKRGRGCPYCRNKTEGKIGVMLRRSYKDIESQAAIVINGICYRFDYQIKDFDPMVYVEYHGELHYYPVDIAGKGQEWAIWNSSRVKRNDSIKADYCRSTNAPLIIVPYWEEFPISFVQYKIEQLIEKSLIKPK